jgi:hypothetical protein
MKICRDNSSRASKPAVKYGSLVVMNKELHMLCSRGTGKKWVDFVYCHVTGVYVTTGCVHLCIRSDYCGGPEPAVQGFTGILACPAEAEYSGDFNERLSAREAWEDSLGIDIPKLRFLMLITTDYVP